MKEGRERTREREGWDKLLERWEYTSNGVHQMFQRGRSLFIYWCLDGDNDDVDDDDDNNGIQR